MGQIHTNLYKIVGWVNAGYTKAAAEELAKGQLAAIDKTSTLMQEMTNTKAIDQDSKGLYQLALMRLGEYRAAASQVTSKAVTDNPAATKSM